MELNLCLTKDYGNEPTPSNAGKTNPIKPNFKRYILRGRQGGKYKRGLSGFLEGGEGGVFVTCEVEDAIKACEGKDTFIVDGKATEDKTMLIGTYEVSQFYEIIDAYGGYHIDAGEVNY